MSTTKHTPGPWEVAANGTTVLDAENRKVADTVTDGWNNERHRADAAFIAAAPELLALIEDTYLYMKMFHSDSVQFKDMHKRLKEMGFSPDEWEIDGFEIG